MGDCVKYKFDKSGGKLKCTCSKIGWFLAFCYGHFKFMCCDLSYEGDSFTSNGTIT